MALHNSLLGSELHEPKGADTASDGMMYVADGAGSGSWVYSPTGFVRYADAGAAQVFTTTPAKISIDGAGANSTELYLPRAIRGVGSLYNITTNFVTPVAEGDAYTMRLDLPITAKSGSAALLTIVLDIGGAAGITIPILTRDISVGKTPPFDVSITTNFDCLNTFFANGGQIFASTDANTVTVTNPTIQLTRVHGEI